jgi:hypothetical protein
MLEVAILGAILKGAGSCKHVASSNAAFTDLPNGYWYAGS